MVLSSCSCQYHLSQLKQKGCWKDSIVTDTFITEKPIYVSLPKDTIHDTLQIKVENGIILDMPYRTYHKGIYHLKLGLFGGKLDYYVWGDTIYKTFYKDTTIYKTITNTVTLKPSIKDYYKFGIDLLIAFIFLLFIIKIILKWVL